MQVQNEFHLQPNSCFARTLDWKMECNLKTMAKGGVQLLGP